MKRFMFILALGMSLGALSLSGCGSKHEPQVFYVDDNSTEVDKSIVAPELDYNALPTSAAQVRADSTKPQVHPSTIHKPFKTFRIYSDANSPDNNFAPSGWMGDYSDLSFSADHANNPHSGVTSIQVKYNNKASLGARWAGIYWQNPANNWGNRDMGFDLTGANRLVFWVRGEKGGERIEEFKMGGISGEFADSDVAGIGPVVLTTEWTRYEISLEGKDLSSIIGGFCWATNLDGNPDGLTFYLDDIRYE